MRFIRLTRAAAIVAITLALCACLASKGPLLPSGTFRAQTPLKKGWYLETKIYRLNGSQAEYQLEPSPVLLKLSGTIYEYYSGAATTPIHRFQFFASKKSDGVMVAQTVVDKNDTMAFYQRFDILHGGNLAVTTEHDCNASGGKMDPSTFELMADSRRMIALEKHCEFNDAVSLMSAATFGRAWPNAQQTMYQRINDKDVFALDKMADGPKTLKACDEQLSLQTVDSSLGGSADISGPRRHLVAASASKAVGIEANGTKFGRWAYLLSRADGTMNTYCKFTKLIRADVILSARSPLSAQSSKKQIVEQCARMTAKECGTIDDMMAAYDGTILVQGPEIISLPRGGSTYGAIITVLGERGNSKLTVLRTEKSGLTRLLSVM